MVKKILRVISIIISIVILIVIWMHIDVTIGRKVEVEKNQPKEYGQHYSDFQLYVEGNRYISSCFLI